MRLLFYISTIRGGGAGRVLSNLANHMVSIGNEVCFVTNFPDEKDYCLDNRVDRKNIEKYDGEHGRYSKNFVRIFGLKRIIKEFEPDVCLSFMGENNFRLLFANLFSARKCIVSIRNDPSMEYRSTLSRILAKFLYLRADGIVFQTKDAKNWFSERIQQKSEIIYNAVAEEFFCVQRSTQCKDIVAMGRLTAQKNYPLLLNAFKRISDMVDENLLIYGEGELREQLKEQIINLNLEGRVFLVGTTTKVPEVLSQAKAFVMTSDYEGMPNALMEALTVGVPVVCTDCPCGGPKMLINNNENGLLVPVGDEEALADAMKKVMSAEAFAEQLSRNAKSGALTFKPELVFENWATFIEEVHAK